MNIVNQEYINRGLNSALYWPANQNYKISGNYLSSNFQFVQVTLKKWSGNGWQPQALINTVLEGLTVSVVVLSSYMDFNDYTTPIKSYFDDSNAYLLVSSLLKNIRLYLKLSTAEMEDDYLKIKSEVSKQYFEVDKSVEDMAPIHDNCCSISIAPSPLGWGYTFWLYFILFEKYIPPPTPIL